VRLGALLTLLITLYFVVPVSENDRGDPVVRALASLLVLVALAATVLVQVRMSAGDPNRHVDGLVIVIVLVWLVFSLAFYLMAQRRPDQVADLHTRLDGLYFAASTMLTIGYGDVHATGQAARALVLVQMLFDVVFVGIAVTMLTTRIRNRAAEAREGQARRTQRKPT
jgi:NADH:ubiquinone oxidoreductase subunit 2 (subunit N)